MFAPWKKSYDQSRQNIKKQIHYFADKGPSNQSYDFSSSHVWMWELVHKESWVPKNWCFLTVVLKKTLESPVDCKEIKSVNLKGNQSWIFTGRTDVEAEAPILWPPDVKNWPTGKDLDAGKDWRQEKGMTEWDDWNASPTQWTWVWVSSGSWWWTGKPGMLQSMGLQTVGHDWAMELNWPLFPKCPLLLLLSHFSHVRLCATPWTAAYQAPPSMGFSREEYWSGLPLPSLPNVPWKPPNC